MIEAATLLQPISADEPSGPNLEYDAAFLELERSAQYKPEQEIGSTLVPAEEPDWRAVELAAAELLGRAKDLRVANHLTKALIHTSGFPGLEQGLALLRGLVEGFWPTLHPQLDPDDDNDPTIRVNILAELCDSATYISWARLTPLVSVKQLGRFNLRDAMVVSGEMPWPASAPGKPPEATTIDAAFQAADLQELRATLEAIRTSRQHVVDIEKMVTEQVGVGRAANLSAFRAVLDQAGKVVDKHYSMRAPAAASDGAQEQAGSEAGGDKPSAGRLSGEIGSREEVLVALDKILAYYNRHEPSSPIPLFIQRCKRLVNMAFLDILRDMAPDGVPQAEVIWRPKEEDGST